MLQSSIMSNKEEGALPLLNKEEFDNIIKNIVATIILSMAYMRSSKHYWMKKKSGYRTLNL